MKKVITAIFIFLFSFTGGIVSKYYYDVFMYYHDVRVIGYKDNGLLEQIYVVPDERTALKIAKAVWLPIYGGKNLLGYSYKIELIEGKFWIIIGVKKINRYFGSQGGGPYIHIERETGTILQVGHGGADPKGYYKRDVSVSVTDIENTRQTQ